MADHVIELPMRNSQLFSPEINCQALAAGRLHLVLLSAIQAMPYVEESERRENLKRALCDFLLGHAAV